MGPSPGTSLTIGLVNGMPGEAQRQTEQQFRAILAAASGDTVRLDVFVPGPGPGPGSGSDDAGIGSLAAAGLDGLIVTGMPPRAARLIDEPFWPRLTALADFALDRAIPTVWSCLAAHAVVLHLDGIERRRMPRKLAGLMDCTRTEADHPMARDLPDRWRVPHSRYNDVAEDVLRAGGYRILSHSADAGADIFTKEFGAGDVPFLFCQGHPEYDADTLLREYRRDVRQYLSGANDAYPEAPHGMFGEHASTELEAFRDRAIAARHTDTLAAFPWAICAAGLDHAWRDLTVRLYSNWLTQIAQRRTRHACPQPMDNARVVARP